MTVIAWDGTTLAADREASDAWMKCGSMLKIHAINGNLVGCSGNAAEIAEVLVWFRAGADPDKFPAALRNEKVKMMVITPERRVRVYDSTPYGFEYCEAPGGVGLRMAIGSGREAAMAAMLAGVDARRAVEIASIVSVGCGNGIDTLELP